MNPNDGGLRDVSNLLHGTNLVRKRISKKTSRSRTVLDGAKPLSDEESRQLATEWVDRTLDTLLAFARPINWLAKDGMDRKLFAEKLCAKVASEFSRNDELSDAMLQTLEEARKGKPRNRKNLWTHGRYFMLLVNYGLYCKIMTRKQALTRLAMQEGYKGDNKERQIEKRITAARKLIKPEELPEACR